MKNHEKTDARNAEAQSVRAVQELNSLDIQIAEEKKKSAAIIGKSSIDTALTSSIKLNRDEVIKANMILETGVNNAKVAENRISELSEKNVS